VGRVGNYVAFPLRSDDFTTPEWRTSLTAAANGPLRPSQEITVTLPIPGVWLRSELFPAHVAAEADAGTEQKPEAGRVERRKRG